MNKVVSASATLDDVLPKPLDVFICSASFEDRCLVVPRMVERSDAVGSVVVCHSIDHLSAVGGNLGTLNMMFGDSLGCELNGDDPIANAEEFKRTLSRFFDGQEMRNIGVDITTFTRESLLILLRCLVQFMEPTDALVGFYNRAATYEGVGKENQWLSRGVREIRSVLGYPGDFMPTQHTHLVILAGFEDDRAFRVATEVEPTVLSLGLPSPVRGHGAEHSTKMTARRDRWLAQKDRWLSYLGSRIHEFYFHGYSITEGMETIRGIVNREKQMNTVLAAMNTKMSTVAAGVFALHNPEVQISYAQAEVYNYDQYSTAADDVYVFSLQDALRPLLGHNHDR